MDDPRDLEAAIIEVIEPYFEIDDESYLLLLKLVNKLFKNNGDVIESNDEDIDFGDPDGFSEEQE